VDEIRELAVREALFSHLDELLETSVDATLTWDQTASFKFYGENIPIRQTRGGGINKPASLDGALSITTTFTPFGREPPYNDFEGADGHPRYKYQGKDPNLYTNRSLRVSMEYGLPLVYFVAVLRGVYKPIYPIFVIADDINRLEVTLGFNRSEVGLDTSTLSNLEKRYALAETRRRLHQPIFRERVLHAYSSSCAICSIKHRELLDAAHIIGDSKPKGDPIVPNGIALCKIHHAAFDRNFIGIRPDYRIVVNADLLNEIDGPMLRHGIQEMNGSTIKLPHSTKLKPDTDRLAIRFHEFLNAN
jgi:putative restriction endonuclease